MLWGIPAQTTRNVQDAKIRVSRLRWGDIGVAGGFAPSGEDSGAMAFPRGFQGALHQLPASTSRCACVCFGFRSDSWRAWWCVGVQCCVEEELISLLQRQRWHRATLRRWRNAWRSTRGTGKSARNTSLLSRLLALLRRPLRRSVRSPSPRIRPQLLIVPLALLRSHIKAIVELIVCLVRISSSIWCRFGVTGDVLA